MPSTLPTPTTVLHLLRSLLRETSYLSDSQARTYLHNHIVRSFRRYSPRKPKRDDPALTLPKLLDLLRKGRRGLSTISRANQGYESPLQLVLCWTYGRKGKRRRQLLTQLTRQRFTPLANPTPSPSAPPRFSRRQLPPKEFRPPIRPPPLVQALLTSLAHHQNDLTRLRNAFNVFPTPQFPKTNNWDRPLSLARQRNLTSRWYAGQLDKLYPPLPKDEVRRLRALVGYETDGVDLSADGPVSRRPKAKPVLEEEVPIWAQGEEGLKVLTPLFLLDGAKKPSRINAAEHGRPHVQSPRYLRRMYRSILEHVPIVETVEGSEPKFKVSWPIQPSKGGLVGDVDGGGLRGVDVGLLFGSDMKGGEESGM